MKFASFWSLTARRTKAEIDRLETYKLELDLAVQLQPNLTKDEEAISYVFVRDSFLSYSTKFGE